MNVEQTYAGNPFLVTVAGYDTDFLNDTAYEDYGLAYNTGSQVACATTASALYTYAYMTHFAAYNC